MTPEQIAALESATKMPMWGWVVLGVTLLIVFLVGIDKAGYYLKRKRTAHFSNGDTVKKDDLTDAFEKAINRHQRNGNAKFTPGHAQACIDHGEQLAALAVIVPRMQSDVKGAFSKIKSVDSKVDRNLEKTTELIDGAIVELKDAIEQINKTEGSNG